MQAIINLLITEMKTTLEERNGSIRETTVETPKENTDYLETIRELKAEIAVIKKEAEARESRLTEAENRISQRMS